MARQPMRIRFFLMIAAISRKKGRTQDLQTITSTITFGIKNGPCETRPFFPLYLSLPPFPLPFLSLSSPFPLPFLSRSSPFLSLSSLFPFHSVNFSSFSFSPFSFPFSFSFSFSFPFLVLSFPFPFPFSFLSLSFFSPFPIFSFPFLYSSFSFSLSSLM